MMKTMSKGALISLALSALCLLGWTVKGGQNKDPLLFPKDSFNLETKTVKTSMGEKKVSYRSYMHIPYVANPVDKDYESLDISVPVRIDGLAVDAGNAPILFVIGVGGYMSSRNADGGAGNSPPTGGMGVSPGAGMGGPPGSDVGGPPAGGIGSPPPGIGRGGPHGGNRRVSPHRDLALAAGYVVVSPGCRGRDNKAADGTYYGKAPAAIVDLKAAVRYLRHNKGVVPGNVDRIVSVGTSAGGALSALLGASGNSPMFAAYLKEIAAAEADDNIHASACFCPITDLEHADGAYEWMYGTLPARSGPVDQTLSRQLKDLYIEYQASLQLKGKNDFGIITADNYPRYLLQYFLIPSANEYLRSLTEEKRREYLAENEWITWAGKGASFAIADYVTHVGRMKGLPAFDDFAMKQAEPILFGSRNANARHFTDFSLRQTTGDRNIRIDGEMQKLVNSMNAMYFIGQNHAACAKYWWIRHGTGDNHTSPTVIINLATSLENRGKEVNTRLYWDAGHGSDEDPEDFIAWIGGITGFTKKH